jgi:hypothetical protein
MKGKIVDLNKGGTQYNSATGTYKISKAGAGAGKAAAGSGRAGG